MQKSRKIGKAAKYWPGNWNKNTLFWRRKRRFVANEYVNTILRWSYARVVHTFCPKFSYIRIIRKKISSSIISYAENFTILQKYGENSEIHYLSGIHLGECQLTFFSPKQFSKTFSYFEPGHWFWRSIGTFVCSAPNLKVENLNPARGGIVGRIPTWLWTLYKCDQEYFNRLKSLHSLQPKDFYKRNHLTDSWMYCPISDSSRSVFSRIIRYCTFFLDELFHATRING